MPTIRSNSAAHGATSIQLPPPPASLFRDAPAHDARSQAEHLTSQISGVELVDLRREPWIFPLLTQPQMAAGVSQGVENLPEPNPGRIHQLNEILHKVAGLRPEVAWVIDLRGRLAKQSRGESEPDKRSYGIHFRDQYPATMCAFLGPQLPRIAHGGQ